jgi:hypothetical protein
MKVFEASLREIPLRLLLSPLVPCLRRDDNEGERASDIEAMHKAGSMTGMTKILTFIF